MINASEKWVEKQKDLLAPEGFVEISLLMTEKDIQDDVTISANRQNAPSNISHIQDINNEYSEYKWATTEPNLWELDGTRNIYDESNRNIGFMSSGYTATITLNFSKIHIQLIDGVTITWSEEFKEWATDITITAYNDSTVVNSKRFTGNTEIRKIYDIELQNYNKIVITVNGWSVPNHFVRIEKLIVGANIIYTKDELMSYTHSQTASHISAELPKNEIKFSIDNTSKIWNPNNPQGYSRYLTDRQAVKIKYGFDIDGQTEWIKMGTFYLSEWATPGNGITMDFTARDVLEFFNGIPYTGAKSGTLYQLIMNCINQVDTPSDITFMIDDVLKNYSATIGPNMEVDLAEVMQRCANARCCCMWQSADNVFHIERLPIKMSSYVIEPEVSYTYPEFIYMKQLKAVNINNGAYVLDVNSTGETQTVNNDFITNGEQVATWVADGLKSRKKVSGEWRADPRLDILDKIRINSSYGRTNAVVLTNVKYDFTGAFKGTYEGYVGDFDTQNYGNTGTFYTGEGIVWN